jgi:hypothetical protein
MLNRVVSALIYITEVLLVSASWIGAKIYALGRLFIKVLVVSFSWLRGKARDFARSTAKLLAIGLSWSRVKARAFALALTTAASVSFSWLQIKARDFARSTAKLLAIGLSWSRVKARAFALALTTAASVSFSWLQVNARDFARSTAKLLAIGLSWSRVKARAFALALTDGASASFSWLQVKARDFARSTAKLLAIGLSWSRVKARAFALALTTAASVSYSLVIARSPASSLRRLVSATRLHLRQYRRRCLALAVGVAEAARKGIQRLHRWTEPMMRALTLSQHGSSIFHSGPDNESSLIPKREGHIEPERQHATFPHQEAPADDSSSGRTSSNGSVDAPRNVTDVMVSTVAAAPVSRMDVPRSGNQSLVKARSRKRRRHRKRKRRHAPHGLTAVHRAG